MQVIQYAQDPPKKTNKFLKSVKSSGDEFVLVKDINDAPCIRASKSKVTSKYDLAQSNVIIVVKEIECWYLCGLDSQCCTKLRMQKRLANIDNMTKEDFDRLIPNDMTRIEFMRQILEKYDVATGRQKNKSFRYFLKKWVD
jgi:hypothetical protein